MLFHLRCNHFRNFIKLRARGQSFTVAELAQHNAYTCGAKASHPFNMYMRAYAA